MMAEYTRDGGGSDAPEAERTFELIVQDVFRHIACFKLVSRAFMDYLHLAKLNDRWLIVNVMWELREGEVRLDSCSAARAHPKRPFLKMPSREHRARRCSRVHEYCVQDGVL
jgi:Putative lumazine-binding